MVTVVTAAYGDFWRHGRYAAALLSSLFCEDRGVERVVFVTDFADEHVQRLVAPYGAAVEVVRIGHVPGDRSQKVARKLWAWEQGLAHVGSRGEHVLFLDSDTLVLQPLYLVEGEVQRAWVAYTRRTGRWPLNSGVVYVNARGGASTFIHSWRTHTDALLRLSPGRAQELAAEYGAVDQASLASVLKGCREAWGFDKVHALPAARWNQDDRVEDLSDVVVAHVKGCLPLLFDERPWGPEHGDSRSVARCRNLFMRWHEAFNAHVAKVGEVFV